MIRARETYGKLKPGESCLLAGRFDKKQLMKLRNNIWAYGRRHGLKFTTQQCPEGLRVTRSAENAGRGIRRPHYGTESEIKFIKSLGCGKWGGSSMDRAAALRAYLSAARSRVEWGNIDPDQILKSCRAQLAMVEGRG